MTHLVRKFITEVNTPLEGFRVRLTHKHTNTPLAYALAQGGPLIRSQDLVTDASGGIRAWLSKNEGFCISVLSQTGKVLHQEHTTSLVGPESGIIVKTSELPTLDQQRVVATYNPVSAPTSAPILETVTPPVDAISPDSTLTPPPVITSLPETVEEEVATPTPLVETPIPTPVVESPGVQSEPAVTEPTPAPESNPLPN